MKFKLIDRGYGMKEIKRDLKEGVILASAIVPFPFLGLFSAAWWLWAIYAGWIALVIYANRPKKKRRGKKFEHFEITEDKAA